MKMNLIYSIGLLAVFTLVNSCTRVIDLQLRDDSGQLDIEANLTNVNGPQSVILRRNVPFSSTNDYPPVTGATVTLTNQTGNTFRLAEEQPGNYTINPFWGIAGNTYTLNVVTGGQVYSAGSTMPAAVRLDSLSDKNRPLNRDQGQKAQKVITAYYQDPPGVANEYRFIEWVNAVQVKSVFTYDDQLTDGKYVILDLLEQDIDIYPGDTVKVEMQCIDRPVYTYWFALESQQANNFNGAVAPANPPTNVAPATLGYFSAHTAQTIIFIVK
ncbi:MAG TPA: DUF4249 domain-containing protein [Chitinophagaceae bacterium]|jgi:hypothetical protein